ncbi:alpha/beta fold hydrolase [Solimonas flava]|uniref:alpha/beta fold hydrolase n=1 Tax=Solimonas flava TaxID=415849 RepID=UPI000416D374|nr:alpha/beta hydrolase [Solimonas flava]
MSLTRWRDTGAAFDFDGHRIFIHPHGEGDEALLLLHGFPTASWDYEGLWPGLCKRFGHVIAFDLLGLGFSDKPYPHRYGVAEQADLAERLLAARGVRRVHLLAHNYGVCIAQELLARAIERRAAGAAAPGTQPLSAVFLNGGLFPEASRQRRAQHLLRSPFGPLLARLSGPRFFARSFLPLFGAQTRPGLIELHDYWTLITLSQGQRVLRDLLGYVDERRQQRRRWSGALLDAGVPMRFICGAQDPVAGPAMAARYRELVPSPDVVMIDAAGHYPHVETPDRCLRAFVAFHDTIGGLS